MLTPKQIHAFSRRLAYEAREPFKLMIRRLQKRIIIGAILGLAISFLIVTGYVATTMQGEKKVEAVTEAKAAEVVELNIEKKKIEPTPVETVLYQALPQKGSRGEIALDLSAVCANNGFTDNANEVCWKTLYAMADQESTLGKRMTGDQGRSRGWFHIQTAMHGVDISCANDLYCSADWTLKRLMAKGFPERWTYAVQSHNGFGTPAAKRGEYAKIIQAKMALID